MYRSFIAVNQKCESFELDGSFTELHNALWARTRPEEVDSWSITLVMDTLGFLAFLPLCIGSHTWNGLGGGERETETDLKHTHTHTH